MKTNFNKTNPKKLLGYLMALAVMVFSFNVSAQTDTITISLVDSYGDSWNGGNLNVGGVDYTVDGVNDDGFNADFDVAVDLSTCVNVDYTAGSYAGENSFTITDGSGAVLASMTSGYNGFNGTIGFCAVYGCTDTAAANYDAAANTDDGTCTYGIPGCTDATACNYDGAATADDGSCTYAVAPLDCNGNCVNGGDAVTVTLYDSYGDGGGEITVDGNVLSNPNSSSNSMVVCVDLSGCVDITYVSTDSWSYENSWDVVDASGNVIASGDDASGTVGNCFVQVDGCTDSTALNYDALANTDDGTCTYCVDGCTDPTQFNYDANATCDDGSCQPFVYGCTDTSASNYYAAANISDGSCIWTGCTDQAADNYDAIATVDDGSCTYTTVSGCTDPTAANYDATATVDDGSCTWTACGAITGVNLTDVIHDRAVFNWDDMNDSSCVVDQIRIRYRAVGTSSWDLKTMGAPVGNNAPCLNTSKLVLNLTASTQYEYDFKIWYQNGTNVNWHSGGTFTTADVCVNATNMTATPVNTTKTSFCWTNPASHEFVRLQYRENVPGSSFSNIGGFGVMAPATCKDKNGLTPGLQYRVMWRTWCNATGGAYRSPVWDGPVIWDQPLQQRVEGGTAINNLDVYPNPSRDIFNVTFTSEDVQDLEVRVINVVGEVVYTENLQQFVGEYTKQVNLNENATGIYFLEIETNDGVVNKKLILQ